jgi:putative ABC transport system substrate-binding protein
VTLWAPGLWQASPPGTFRLSRDPELSGKRLQLLRETLPRLARVALLWDAGNVGMADRVKETEAAALQLGVTLHVEWVRDLAGLDRAFATLAQARPDAFLTTVEPFTGDHRQRIVAFAAQQRLPAMYEERDFVDAGGLMACGPNLAAIPPGRDLRGQDPEGDQAQTSP